MYVQIAAYNHYRPMIFSENLLHAFWCSVVEYVVHDYVTPCEEFLGLITVAYCYDVIEAGVLPNSCPELSVHCRMR